MINDPARGFLNFDMRGETVLVTGAGTGIGREIALAFARCGADVVFHHSSSSAGALSGVIEAEVLGVRAIALRADLSNLDEVARLATDAEAALGKVDILVNNSGITYNAPFLQMEADRFQKLYDVNVRAGFFLTQALVPAMIKRRGGTILNLTSVHGLQGAAEHAAYAGTKGAIIAQTRALGIELAYQGVRVNAIAPGWIDVENHALAVPHYDAATSAQTAARQIPVGRIGKPADIAQLALFLCSEAASFITGQCFVADGGTTALMSLFPDFRSPSNAHFGERYMGNSAA